MQCYAERFSCPAGDMASVVASDGTVLRIAFLRQFSEEVIERSVHAMQRGPLSWRRGSCGIVRDQLNEYFEGRRRVFDLELVFHGTPFQERVWKELRRIPFGRTATYGELARRIGMPRASRAVGQANNRNPISIVVPCHRVIGHAGSLVGFGGGLKAKEALLRFEEQKLSLFA